MAVTRRMSEQEYQDLVLSGVDGHWELHDGRLVEKPAMTFEHGDTTFMLGLQLGSQLERRQFRVAINGWRVRRSEATIFVLDLVVIPTSYAEEFRGQPAGSRSSSGPCRWSSRSGRRRLATTTSRRRSRSTRRAAIRRSVVSTPTSGR
jgi:hypothetical protein